MSKYLYHLYDMHHWSMTPMRYWAETTKKIADNPMTPIPYTQMGRFASAWADLSHRMMARYARPEFGIDTVTIDNKSYKVEEENLIEKPFCHLKHFKVKTPASVKREKILLCAPLSGHFATLLRGTVKALLPHHDVYITDWQNARRVPLSKGRFDLDDCIQYFIEFIRFLGPDVHCVAVCQPAVPVTCAVALLAGWSDKAQPKTLTLMGGPIDTRISATEVNKLAEEKPLDWFRRNVVTDVPAWYEGAKREVYPGFLQLSGFMSMNMDRHVGAHMQYFEHLVEGDGESAEQHRKFYDEYLAVMDLPAEFYLQTVKRVFQEHALPKREFFWHGEIADCGDITKTALLTIEGERDDISAPGQTKAAHDIFINLPKSKKKHHLQKGAGHYGIFNGRKWRDHVRPVITKFIKDHAK